MRTLPAIGLLGWLALAATAPAQTVELHLVLDPNAPTWAAIDFEQTIIGPDDTWLAAELQEAVTASGATFRYIPVDDPNRMLRGHLVPDRDQNGASLDERFTTFFSLPRPNQNAPARYSAADLVTAGDPVYEPNYAHQLLGVQYPAPGIIVGLAGYFARVSIQVPGETDPAALYVDNGRRSASDRILAKGLMAWGTYSSVNDFDNDPSVETKWVIAETRDGPPEPNVPLPFRSDDDDQPADDDDGNAPPTDDDGGGAPPDDGDGGDDSPGASPPGSNDPPGDDGAPAIEGGGIDGLLDQWRPRGSSPWANDDDDDDSPSTGEPNEPNVFVLEPRFRPGDDQPPQFDFDTPQEDDSATNGPRIADEAASASGACAAAAPALSGTAFILFAARRRRP